MKKLVSEEGDRKFAKYYEKDEMAQARMGRKWRLEDVEKLPAYISHAINTGELKEPRYSVSWSDVDPKAEILVYSEGAANNLMIELSKIHRSVKVYELRGND